MVDVTKKHVISLGWTNASWGWVRAATPTRIPKYKQAQRKYIDVH